MYDAQMGRAHRTVGRTRILAVRGGGGLRAGLSVEPIRIIVPNATGGLRRHQRAAGRGASSPTRSGSRCWSTTAPARAAPSARRWRSRPRPTATRCSRCSTATRPTRTSSRAFRTTRSTISRRSRCWCAGPLLLVVHPGLGVRPVSKSWSQLATRKARRDQFRHRRARLAGAPADGTAARSKAGIDVTNVPYKGAGLALADLVGGQVDAMFATVPSIGAHWRSGPRARARDHLGEAQRRRARRARDERALSGIHRGVVGGHARPARTPRTSSCGSTPKSLGILAEDRDARRASPSWDWRPPAARRNNSIAGFAPRRSAGAG